MCQTLGVQHIMTTAYQPQSNGMVEWTHRLLKDTPKARLAGLDWPDHLPWVLMGLRAAPMEDANISSAKLVFGAPLVLPGQLLDTPELPPAVFFQQLRNAVPPPPTRPL
jgi:transposase InsO family protein